MIAGTRSAVWELSDKYEEQTHTLLVPGPVNIPVNSEQPERGRVGSFPPERTQAGAPGLVPRVSHPVLSQVCGELGHPPLVCATK